MLPGDFIAMKMTGEICTTYAGLSEGILWDFQKEQLAQSLLDHYDINPGLVSEPKATFSIQGRLTEGAAMLLGLQAGIPVAYRAGDQHKNAFSLSSEESRVGKEGGSTCRSRWSTYY